jgi:hypothetical protein
MKLGYRNKGWCEDVFTIYYTGRQANMLIGCEVWG